MEKICCSCNNTKLLSDFSNCRSYPDGKQKLCRVCKSDSDRKYRDSHKAEKALQDRKYYENNTDAIKAKSKTWYTNNIPRCQETRKNWYLNNQDKVKLSREKWKENNKEFYRDYMNRYIKNKYATNENYRIKSILNKRIRDYIEKSKPTLDYLGCSVEFFKAWIEYQFDDSMSWENQGSYWHFDHVLPCDFFDLSNDDDIHKCYNWTNLQPLEKIENIVKKNKIIPSLIENHLLKVEQYKIYLTDVPK